MVTLIHEWVAKIEKCCAPGAFNITGHRDLRRWFGHRSTPLWTSPTFVALFYWNLDDVSTCREMERGIFVARWHKNIFFFCNSKIVSVWEESTLVVFTLEWTLSLVTLPQHCWLASSMFHFHVHVIQSPPMHLGIFAFHLPDNFRKMTPFICLI